MVSIGGCQFNAWCVVGHLNQCFALCCVQSNCLQFSCVLLDAQHPIITLRDAHCVTIYILYTFRILSEGNACCHAEHEGGCFYCKAMRGILASCLHDRISSIWEDC